VRRCAVLLEYEIVQHGVKVNGDYYREVLLKEKLLPCIRKYRVTISYSNRTAHLHTGRDRSVVCTTHHPHFKFHKVVRQQTQGEAKILTSSYSTIPSWKKSWKIYENPSIFARVIEKIKVARFLWTTVYIHRCQPEVPASMTINGKALQSCHRHTCTLDSRVGQRRI